ncbi:hydrophobic protein [Streptomyces roseoverticillatus]|uniref:Hydrophobic protein n=1 Tax=Streptomyces roseoverticillatus TaxID=66429 RepID=A0ABV3J355_9ACTN
MIVWTVLLLLTLLLFGSRLLRALLWIDAAVALIVWIPGFGRRTRSRG